MSNFKSDYDILDGLNGLADISASLDADFKNFEAVRLKMLEKGESHFKAVHALLQITTGESKQNLRDAVLAARWEYRDQALVFLEASRLLATMAGKMKSVSEQMARLVAPEGDKTV